MYFAVVYLIDSTHKLMSNSSNNEPRLSLFFSVICIVLKTIDMFFEMKKNARNCATKLD